jgi:hypothetical protein
VGRVAHIQQQGDNDIRRSPMQRTSQQA